MNTIQTNKRDLLILSKQNNINRIRLNISNVYYMIDRDGKRADVTIIDGVNHITENVSLPKTHFCKGKTVSGKRCKNKTYDNFCHIH